MYRTVKDFISQEEAIEILNCKIEIDTKPIENEHIKAVNDATNGYSILCDLTKTEVSSTVSKFQGDGTLVEKVPEFYHQIAKRISETLGISDNHVFFQYIYIGPDGYVRKHYDAGVPGYVTYKCNIFVEGFRDCIFVDNEPHVLEKHELYCFEANFYKHWMHSWTTPRTHLSYGFLVPYEELGWKDTDPRVRLSNRIWNAYIKKMKS